MSLPTTQYKIKIIKETMESIGVLIGTLAMLSRAAPRAYSDVRYAISMLKHQDIFWEPGDELDFEEAVNTNGETSEAS